MRVSQGLIAGVPLVLLMIGIALYTHDPNPARVQPVASQPGQASVPPVTALATELRAPQLPGAEAELGHPETPGRQAAAIPRSPLSDAALVNIRDRLRFLEVYRSALEEGTELDADPSTGASAFHAAELSVLVIFDGQMRSRFQALPGESMLETFSRVRAQGGNEWYLPEGDAHRITSGGADYEVPLGEFPVYDALVEASRENGGSIPRGAIPFEELDSLMDLAVSFGQ